VWGVALDGTAAAQSCEEAPGGDVIPAHRVLPTLVQMPLTWPDRVKFCTRPGIWTGSWPAMSGTYRPAVGGFAGPDRAFRAAGRSVGPGESSWLKYGKLSSAPAGSLPPATRPMGCWTAVHDLAKRHTEPSLRSDN